MKMRRFTMGLTALALMGTMALPVSAEEIGNTEITTTINSTYTLTIPAKTTVDFNAESTDLSGVLKVAGNVLPTEEVTVTADAKAFHNDAQDTDLPYTLEEGENGVFTTATWEETELRAGLAGEGQGKELQLSVHIQPDEWAKAESGTYNGSIVFTADLQTK